MSARQVFEHAHATPERIALYNDGVAVSYRDFARRIARARAFLAEQELRAGSLVVLCIGNLLEAWVARLALSSLGQMTASVKFLREIKLLASLDIGCVIVRASESRPALTGVAKELGFRYIRLPAELETAGTAAPDRIEMASPAGGHLVFTSGTTGTAKQILIDAKNEETHIRQRLEAFDISANSIVDCLDWALWTSVGYSVPLGVWSIGASAVFFQQPQRYVSLAQQGITHAIATPIMVQEILAAPKGALPLNNDMKLFVGGGPLPQSLAQAALTSITRQLFTVVGSTEVGVWCVTRIERPEDVTSHRIAPSRVVQIVDEAHEPLPAGQTGSVRIGLLEGTAEYYKDEEASHAFFRDGYFYSGDLGSFDGDGRLTLQGRATDIVYVDGTKRAATPIEEALQHRLGAGSVCVFSVQDGRLDEELHVAVEGQKRVDDATLTAIRGEQLSRFPRVRFHFVAAFPRNDRGKIERHVLKQQILASLKA